MDIEGNHAERRSFQFIQAKNIADVFGRCEVEFWNVVVLRFSHSHPAVRQSLLALSAVYEVYEQHKDRTIKHFNLEYAAPHALQQYSKAVSSLTRRIGSPENDPRAVLISCLIFTWIEVMMDNMEMVFKHLVGGVTILAEMKAACLRREAQGGMFQFDVDGIYISIARSLLRLRFQTSVELTNLQDFNLIEGFLLEEPSTPHMVDKESSRASNLLALSQLENLVSFNEHALCLEFVFIDNERLHERSPKNIERPYRDRNANHNRKAQIRSMANLYNELDRVTIQAVQYSHRAATSEEKMDEISPYYELVDLVQEISIKRKGMASIPVLDVGVLPSLTYTLLVSIQVYIPGEGYRSHISHNSNLQMM